MGHGKYRFHSTIIKLQNGLKLLYSLEHFIVLALIKNLTVFFLCNEFL